jgi:hypothetical protein
MITPVIIQILFWILIALVVIAAIVSMFNSSFFYGLFVLVVGPVMVRVWCEILIVIFNMSGFLHDINESLKEIKQRGGTL